ncbi:hypothetical protein ACJQWK_02805 [Exserohilum turcicum]|uniref:Uncharacterized protein n=1 Tax=Exserohilum turcicum (strain 28A) TaxID=671987 RepID=R0IYW3_EXST2|nr:uncharacterized protein SETTUDRAFT_37383 [Exserohilum turcica Et28A]EOA89726.1 hypothetical protein SETTUDRAFT_37383 [Exserohilum turcica Et28A]
MSWIVTEVRQSLRTNVAPDDDVPRTAITLHGDDEESFLPENLGVTGREPNTNPPNWPADHRRVPAHRFPILNPNWTAIAGPLPMRILLWDMFVGCQLLQWGYSFLRMTGLHDRGLCMYKVANEW